MDSAPHLLLVNPSAGGGRAGRRLAAAERALEGRGICHRVVLTERIAEAPSAAREAARRGETVIVMAGDGMIGQVGGALAGTGVSMGIIPAGRGNDLARVTGIPTRVEDAVELIAAGTTREIDVGEIDGARFLCIASCGFDSEANRIANDARLVGGPLVYLYAALRALAGWRPVTFTLTADGVPQTITGYTVAVANSKAYGGGMFVAPDAELDDGLLDVVAVRDVDRLSFLRSLPQVFRGTHVENAEVVALRAREVHIAADRPLTVYADGDPIAELPATVRLLNRALRLIAPAD